MARDPRISDIFYYFEEYTTIASGRTVGRKIGVVQEIICKKHLQTSVRICDCMVYEPKLAGRSGATHKVEFVLFQPISAVEVSVGNTVPLIANLSVNLQRIDPANQKANLILTVSSKKYRRSVQANTLLKLGALAPASTLRIKVVAVDAGKVRLSVIDTARPIASVESKRVGAQRFSKSQQLGSGIQTIEKAKQASLVAVDFDLLYNGNLLALMKDRTRRTFRSFVVLGNGVHWTPQDLAILDTYVDYTYQVEEPAVIRYADFVRALAKKKKADFFPFFMAYFQGMTKTPPDAFTVSPKDFLSIRPKNAAPFLETLESQIQPYSITTV